MSRRVVRMNVSEELLVHLFNMPEGTQIVNVAKHTFHPDTFVFYLQNDELPEVDGDAEPPLITPLIHKITWDWNLPK